jgi:hypothetical protein
MARRSLKVAILTLPVAGLCLPYIRGWVDRIYTRKQLEYPVGISLAVTVYAVWLAANSGFYYRILFLVGGWVLAAAVWVGPDLADLRRRPELRFAAWALGFMILGYIVRDRQIIVYYALDGWPYLAIGGGVFGTALWRRSTRPTRGMLAVGLVVALIASAGVAAPLGGLADKGYLSLASLHVIGADLDERVGGRQRVLSPNPAYVSGSDVRVWEDNSRVYFSTVLFDGSELAERQRVRLREAMRTGNVSYIIRTHFAAGMFNETNLTAEFRTNYCRVTKTPAAYQRENATLYRYRGDSGCRA